MNSFVKIKWFMLPLVVIVGVYLESSLCQAAYIQTLENMKDAAWTAYWKKGDTSKSELEKNLNMNGAIDLRGGVKVSIDNWKNKAIPKSDEDLLVYATPSTKEVVGELYSDTIMSVISAEGEWVGIHSGYLQGYVRKDSILQGDKAKKRAALVCPRQIVSDYATTTVMSEPNRQSTVLRYMEQRQTYPVLGVKSGWAEIRVSGGLKGYVFLQGVGEVRSIHFGRRIQNIENPQQPFWAHELTAEERRMLAALVYCEAQGEIFEGQVAVVTVVLNRLYSEEYPNTLSEVIYQDNQFQPVTQKRYDAVLKNPEIIGESNYEAVDVAIQGGNTVGDVLYFKVDGDGKRIGNHVFY